MDTYFHNAKIVSLLWQYIAVHACEMGRFIYPKSFSGPKKTAYTVQIKYEMQSWVFATNVVIHCYPSVEIGHQGYFRLVPENRLYLTHDIN